LQDGVLYCLRPRVAGMRFTVKPITDHAALVDQVKRGPRFVVQRSKIPEIIVDHDRMIETVVADFLQEARAVVLAAGRSIGAMWPAPWTSNKVACGILRRIVSCCEIGDHVSSLPLSNRVGTLIVANTDDNASGRFSNALIWPGYESGVERSTIAIKRGMSSAVREVPPASIGGSHSAASADMPCSYATRTK
jgi:hypothetical protein